MPGTLAQTVMIERGIVIVSEGAASILPAPVKAGVKAYSITEEMFYETIGVIDGALPQAIRDFLKLVEPMGVYADFKAALNLKVQIADAVKPNGLGYIQQDGKLWTDAVAATTPPDLARAYNETLATLIGGQVSPNKGMSVTTNGKSGPRIDLLLPEHAQGWATAIRDLLTGIERRAMDAA